MMTTPRGRRSPNLVILVVAFGLIGMLCFEIVKERRVTNETLDEKAAETTTVRKKLEEMNDVADELRQSVSRLKLENEKLAVEKNSLRKQLIELEREKSTTESEKQDLVDTLQVKKDEIGRLKGQVAQLKQKEEDVALLKEKLNRLEEVQRSAKEHEAEGMKRQNMEKVPSSENADDKSLNTSPERTEGKSKDRSTDGNKVELEENQSSDPIETERELKGGLPVETVNVQNDDQMDEGELQIHPYITRLDHDTGDHIAEHEEMTEENKEVHEGEDKDDRDSGDSGELQSEVSEEKHGEISERNEGNEKDEAENGKIFGKNEDTSNPLKDIEDSNEAHLESLEHRADAEVDEHLEQQIDTGVDQE